MTEAKSGVNTMDPHVAALVQATTGFYASALAPRPARARCFYPEIDEAAERFRARGVVGLTCGPSIDFPDFLFGKAKRHHGVLTGSRSAHLFLWYYVLS